MYNIIMPYLDPPTIYGSAEIYKIICKYDDNVIVRLGAELDAWLANRNK